MEEKKSVKKKRGVFRGTLSLFFDLPRWIDAKSYVQTNKTLYEKIKDTFRIAKAERKESFEEAMKRLNLKEKDIQARIKHNKQALNMLLFLILLLCLYGLYLFFNAAWSALILLFGVIIFTSVRAFKYSFWNFQMTEKKLGCSFREWMERKKR